MKERKKEKHSKTFYDRKTTCPASVIPCHFQTDKLASSAEKENYPYISIHVYLVTFTILCTSAWVSELCVENFGQMTRFINLKIKSGSFCNLPIKTRRSFFQHCTRRSKKPRNFLQVRIVLTVLYAFHVCYY